MADTVRTLAQLQALLPDNVAGDISPQDLRDFLVSVLGVYGAILVTDGVTGQTPGTTPVKLTAFTTNGLARNVVPDHTNDRLTIGANGAGDYLIIFQSSFSGSNNATFELEFYLNQVATGYKTSRKLGSAGDVGSASLIGLGSLVDGDEIEIFVDGGAGESLTVEDAQLIAVRIG
jgi:hypothetical protein